MIFVRNFLHIMHSFVLISHFLLNGKNFQFMILLDMPLAPLLFLHSFWSLLSTLKPLHLHLLPLGLLCFLSSIVSLLFLVGSETRDSVQRSKIRSYSVVNNNYWVAEGLGGGGEQICPDCGEFIV